MAKTAKTDETPGADAAARVEPSEKMEMILYTDDHHIAKSYYARNESVQLSGLPPNQRQLRIPSVIVEFSQFRKPERTIHGDVTRPGAWLLDLSKVNRGPTGFAMTMRELYEYCTDSEKCPESPLARHFADGKVLLESEWIAHVKGVEELQRKKAEFERAETDRIVSRRSKRGGAAPVPETAEDGAEAPVPSGGAFS